MAGPNERKLAEVTSAQPSEIHDAAHRWRVAAGGLGDVVAQLDKASADIATAWQGKDSRAATSAFDDLSGRVADSQQRLQQGAQALNTAATSLSEAKQAYASLPPVPPSPTAPDPGSDGRVSTSDEVHYLKLQGQRSAAQNQREQAAGQAYQQLLTGLDDASGQLQTAAPEAQTRDRGYTNPGSGGTTSSGASAPSVGGTWSGPTGSSSTSPAATYAGTPTSVTGALGQPVLGHGHDGPWAGVDGPTPDGVVAGEAGVANAPGPTGTASGSAAGGHTGGSGSGPLGGPAGGLGGALGVGGGAGGIAGVLGGAGLGRALGGRGTTGGRLGSARGGAPVEEGEVVGGRTASTRGSVLGGRSSGATAEGETVSGTRGTVGARGAAGGRGGVVGGATEEGGTSAGSRGASGSFAEEETTSTRSTGRAGQAGGRVDEEQAGRGTGRGTGRGPGRGSTGGRTGSADEERARKRRGMVFEDDDAWLGDDEAGPGVMR